MTILVPSDAASMHAAVRAATYYPGPVFLRSSRVAMPQSYPEGDCPFEIGTANVVRRGTDVTIVGCGIMVAMGLDAAAILADEGIDARVQVVVPAERDNVEASLDQLLDIVRVDDVVIVVEASRLL